jgi:hypothetical protein
VLDREKNARLNARVFAIDNPKGPASNQNRRAASVRLDNHFLFKNLMFKPKIMKI